MDDDIKLNYKKLIKILDELCLMYMKCNNLNKNQSYKKINKLYNFLCIHYAQLSDNFFEFEIVSLFQSINPNKLDKILPLKCLEVGEKEIFVEKKFFIKKMIVELSLYNKIDT